MDLPITEYQENQTVQPNIETAQKQPTSLLLWVISAIALLSIAGNAYFYFVSSSQLVPQSSLPLVEEIEPTEDPVSVTAITPPSIKRKLADVLAEECNGQSINFSLLPFAISPELVTKYTKAGITCEDGAISKTERYIAFSNTKSDAVISSYMFIYHPQSSYGTFIDPFINPFTDDTEAVLITVLDKQYALSILEPGPYGISEQAVIVELSAKKTEEMSESTAKAFASSNFKDLQTIQLVGKYGSKPAHTPEDFPIVVDNIVEFKKDFMKNIQTEGTEANKKLKSLIASIDFDLEGISF